MILETIIIFHIGPRSAGHYQFLQFAYKRKSSVELESSFWAKLVKTHKSEKGHISSFSTQSNNEKIDFAHAQCMFPLLWISSIFITTKALIKVSVENEVFDKSANGFMSYDLDFRKWRKMRKRNQMLKFELNWSSGNVITRTDDCCHSYKISIGTKITPAWFCHVWSELAKYWLHTCNDISFVYNSIVKMPPFHPTNLAFKRNLKNLNKSHSTPKPKGKTASFIFKDSFCNFSCVLYTYVIHLVNWG